jgi:hypothetical protein
VRDVATGPASRKRGASRAPISPLERYVLCRTDTVLQHRLDESRRKASRQKEARQERRAIAGPKA